MMIISILIKLNITDIMFCCIYFLHKVAKSYLFLLFLFLLFMMCTATIKSLNRALELS